MNRSNIIFAFIGGVMVGAAATVGYLKHSGKLARNDGDIDGNSSDGAGSISDSETAEVDPAVKRDKPSFEQPKKMDTHRTDYARIEEKPDLDEMAKKYESENDMENTEEEEDEGEADPEPWMSDIDLPDDYQDPEDQDYGHVIKQIQGKRKNDLIFLIPQEYAGEIYLLEDLNYYAKDDILCDLTDAPVDDPMHVVGDCLEYFGQYGFDEDKVFVRNCTLGIEYEITLINGKYADHLYGVTPEDYEEKPKPLVRKMRKERDDD